MKPEVRPHESANRAFDRSRAREGLSGGADTQSLVRGFPGFTLGRRLEVDREVGLEQLLQAIDLAFGRNVRPVDQHEFEGIEEGCGHEMLYESPGNLSGNVQAATRGGSAGITSFAFQTQLVMVLSASSESSAFR